MLTKTIKKKNILLGHVMFVYQSIPGFYRDRTGTKGDCIFFFVYCYFVKVISSNRLRYVLILA